MKPVVCLLVLSTAVLSADPIAITWTSTPTVTYQCCAGTDEGLQPLILNATQNGPEADLSTISNTPSWNRFPEELATIEIPFEIDAPAEVAVSASANYSGSGTDCGDVSCPDLANWTLYGGFSGGIEITDDNGNEVLFVPFGVNGSAAATCDDLQCSGGLSLSDAESGTVDLAAGTYLLTDSYQTYTDSIGDSWTGLNTKVAVTDPVPEPRISVFWLALGLVVAIGLKKQTKSVQYKDQK